jgi:two-component system response regulator AtoC
MSRVLVVDDEPAVLFTLRELLVKQGHDVAQARSAPEALDQLDGADVVITDLEMGAVSGLALLKQCRERDAGLPVIVLTAHGSERVAVSAMKAGAWDYLTKPFDTDELLLTVERAGETHRLRRLSRRLSAERALNRHIIAESPAMRRLLAAVERVAGRDITVLVRGDTGTGKELIASLLHAQSTRAKGPLVRFNCAAIPGELAEAELFGHTRGAFTGANTARRGYVGQADGGTLILDEIAELSLPIQAKLLRLLQEREIQPVGAGRVERVDVRVVASTHRDLQAEVRAGRFREDLYYRLAVVELKVPPLNERREDVAPLAVEFARRYAEKFGLEGLELSPALVARLEHVDWSGNVRQLENTIARMAALSTGGTLDVGALDEDPQASSDAGSSKEGPSLREQVEAFERNLLARAFAAAGGNQSEAARRLQTSRVTLIDKLKKYRLLDE